MQTRVQIQNRLLPFLVFLLLTLYWLDSYKGWLILGSGLGAMLLVSYAWALTLSHGLNLVHERRFGWAQVGDQLEERFTLQNFGFLPAVWVEILYQTNMPGYQPGRATGLGAHQENTWLTRGACIKRGLFTLGPVSLVSGDPFGVFSVKIHYQKSTNILVMPPIIPVQKLNPMPGGHTGESRLRQHAFIESICSSNVRKYIPGDSIRLIHWPTTARTNDYYVRVLESMPASDWWIFLDLQADLQYGEGFNSTEEHGVILAASLATAGIQLGNAVGLVTQGESLLWQPPHYGEYHRQNMMRALAQACPGPVTIGSMLHHARSAFKYNPNLLIITSNTNPTWTDSLLPFLQKRMRPTVYVLDPSSYSLKLAEPENPTGLIQQLKKLGVSHNLLGKDFFDRPETQPGVQGKWVWSKTPSSRAIAKAKPENAQWQQT